MEATHSIETTIQSTVVIIFLKGIGLPVNVCCIEMALGYQYVLYMCNIKSPDNFIFTAP